MNVKIILFDPYPHGMACTNRIHLYAKGIVEVGASVQILIPRPTEQNRETARNTQIKGRFEGVDFLYTCGTTIRGSTFLMRRLLELHGLIGATRELIRGVKKQNTRAVLFVGNDGVFILYFAIICKLLDIIFLQEKSEIPFFNKPARTLLSEIYQRLYTKYIYKCFDGILVISEALKKYFHKRICKRAKLLQLPIIVDTDEFFQATTLYKKPFTIAYCGNMSESQDGVLTLIRAFKLIADNFPEVRLILMGDTRNADDKQKVASLIRETRLSQKIILAGYLPRRQLIETLNSVSVLVLAKPSNLQSAYCFPSKLAEYLSTGNPVVVTDTGEISNYLEDSLNAYLVEPGNVIALAEKISFVLQNPRQASKVGESGRVLAESLFSYRVHVKRILDFIKNLESEKNAKVSAG